MTEIGGAEHVLKPLAVFGLNSAFFDIDTQVVIQTWIVLLIIFIICLPVKWLLKKRQSAARYLIISFTRSFIDLCNQAMGKLIFKHFAFVTTVFIFILFCNIVPIIPWTEEPTRNLSTTLAMSLTSFLYIQFHAIRTHGLLGYLKEYTDPFPIMAPLHVVSKVASIVSMAFRLFGNIFGGSIISGIYLDIIKSHALLEVVGLCGFNFIILFFFVLFEGYLQAFVFTMLSLTYLSIAIAHEEQSHGAAQ